MKWKNKELKTFGHLMDAITGCKTREEAEQFMTLYSAETPHAFANVGYLSGYLDREGRARVQDWFSTSHPIFGRTEPTAEQALEAGMKIGVEMRKADLRKL